MRRLSILLLLAVVAVVGLLAGRGRPQHSQRAAGAPPTLQLTRHGEGAVLRATTFRPVTSAPPAATTSYRAAAAPPPTFGQPTISGIQGTGFEEDIRLDPTNPDRFYTSVPGALNSATSWIWRTLDGGKTFKWVPAATPKRGKPVACAGGGDTELGVDTAGHLYFIDLTLVNYGTARSDDNGRTFVCSNTGIPDAAVDRQWYATDGDPTAGGILYLVNDEVGQGNVQCGNVVANNVLAMYRSPVPVAGTSAGIEFGPPNKVTPVLSCEEGIMGNDEVSPVATTTGKIVGGQPTTLPAAVKHVYVIHDDAAFSKIAIGRCFPVPFTPVATPNVGDPSGLNCDDLPVASFPGSRTGANFPTMAIDTAGNLYAVWEQAAVTGGKIGNSSLKYAYSTNEGTTWSAPITIPTPGLANNVFAWVAAGDPGRVDVMWVGTSSPVDTTTGGPQGCTDGGPDSANGAWTVYLTQTLNGLDPAPQFTAPILAGEHYMHKGSMQTVMGGQCGDRTVGDFFQLRVGSHGEAHISYSDSNNITEALAPHAMYVRQNGGTGVYANQTVTGDPIAVNSVTDVSGDGTYELEGTVSSTVPKLDVTKSELSKPDPADCHPANTPCYRVTTTLENFSLATTALPNGDADFVYLTQWLVPADPLCTSTATSCVTGGKNFFVYAEAIGSQAPTCWSGENAMQKIGANPSSAVTLTYPGTKQITASGACAFATGAAGTITIEVPIADVSLDGGVAPLEANRLYSVTASTMSVSQPANSVPPQDIPEFGHVGGVPFDLVDVAPAYDAVFASTAVVLRSFSARREGRGVTVRWRTGAEASLLGFDLYRGRTRVNRARIPAHRSTHGGAYVYRDPRGAKGARYRLEAVALGGERRWLGATVAR